MTSNLESNSRQRGATVCGVGGLALASVLLLCGAGNVPIENFTPRGPLQADLNLGGHDVTNAATVTATTATIGTLSATNLTVSGALTGSFPYANLTGKPVTAADGKTLTVNNTLTFAGTDGATLAIGAGGTLGSAAFAATTAFLAPSAVGSTVQAFNANTTTLGNAVNGTNQLVQTDGSGWLVDAVQRPAAKTIHVSQDMGNDTRTGLSKYSLPTPFATLTAAAAAAAAGDTIIVEDGVFTDKNLVLATGVNWLFLPGATITVTDATNGDSIFKDNGTAVTARVAGFGQTFSIASTAGSAQAQVLSVTAASTVTMQDLTMSSTASGSFASAVALYSSNPSAVITVTGNLGTSTSGLAGSHTVLIAATGGGTITINGNVSAATSGFTATAVECASNTTSSGNVTVTGRISATGIAISGSSACTVTCGALGEGSTPSAVYNHLTLATAGLLTQTVSTPSSGFSVTDAMGPEDHLVSVMNSATVASGTINLPADSQSRIGERITLLATQAVTSLAIVAPGSGTIYGYTTGTVGPGSITFEKIAANTWLKL